MTLAKVLRYAILHVGSSSMSITILEYKSIDDVRVIDYAAREVTFGDYFKLHVLALKRLKKFVTFLRAINN